MPAGPGRLNLSAGDSGVGSWTAEGRVTDEQEAASDETLCRRIAARDDAAFDLLVARYQGRAYRLAWSLLRNAEDARDVSQDAFIRVWEAAERFRGDARFSTWFYRILVNRCLDHKRRGRWWTRLVARDDDPAADVSVVERQPAPGPDAGDQVSEAQTMARLWDAVQPVERRPEFGSLDDAMLGARLDLLEHYRVVERLDLFEELDVIRQLDHLPSREG